MEREPNNADEISKTRRISHQITTKLEEGHEVNRDSKKSYEKTI